MSKKIMIASAVALVVLAPMANGPARAAGKNPITISQCFVQQPKPLSKKAGGATIVFTNTGSKDAKNITFQVVYRNSEHKFVRRVSDTGDFRPGVQVDHSYSLYNDVTYGGKETQACAAVSVTWSDGTKWSD